MSEYRTFPIQGGWSRKEWREIKASSIPWDLIALHEAQALVNHDGQDLAKLARRGGLSHCEAVAVLEDREWHKMELHESIDRLAEIVSAGLPA